MCAWSLKVVPAHHTTVSNNALTRVSPMAIPTHKSFMLLQRQNANIYEKSKRLMKNIQHYIFSKIPSMEPGIYQKQLLLFVLLSLSSGSDNLKSHS